MRKWFKKYFIPHQGNNFHPHFFRSAAVLFIILALAGTQLLFYGVLKTLSGNNSYAAIFIGALLSYTNEARASNIGGTLATSPLLTEAAQLKANDMAEKGYFSHNTPDGRTPWYWFNQVGYNYQYAGENLAIDFVDSKDVTDAWMSSPGHRANILNSNYQEIGIATAVGMYQGRETTFVVQMFGSPKPVAAVKPVAQKPYKGPTLSTDSQGRTLDSEKVAGVETENLSVAEEALASPRKSLVDIYTLFLAFVAVMMLFAGLFEFKRHHKAIWLSGGVLILATMGLIALTLQSGQGLI